MTPATFFRKLGSKIRASLHLFKKAEIMENVLNKEINGEYDNLCHQCLYHQVSRMEREDCNENTVRVSIYLGGALGDYIVYLNFVDQFLLMDHVSVTIFLDKAGFADYVFGSRKQLQIVHDLENCLFYNSRGDYDFALHFDHGITIHNCRLREIEKRSKPCYLAACKILEYVKKTRVDISDQQLRQLAIFKKAEFCGDTKWSKLSCGGALSLNEMYSSILLRGKDYRMFKRYGLMGQNYITVNYGADRNMGGESQTKVMPAENLEAFIALFKEQFPQYKVVQTGTKGSSKLNGIDIYAFECSLGETAVLLKHTAIHVDSEGGLVHLASQLSTKCVVCFGPTPWFYYSYPRNINLVSPACTNCMSVTPQWNILCPKGMHHPVCMQSITGEMILEVVAKRLKEKEKQHTCYKLEDTKKQFTLGKNTLNEWVEKHCEDETIAILSQEMGTLPLELDTEYKKITVFTKTEDERNQKDLLAWREKLHQKNMDIRYGTGLNIACPDDSFHTVLLDVGILPGMERVQEVMAELARITVNGGNIICFGTDVNLFLTALEGHSESVEQDTNFEYLRFSVSK